MDGVVYQENGLCPIILGHICSWKILKESDFMVSQGGGECGGTCHDGIKKICIVQSF